MSGVYMTQQWTKQKPGIVACAHCDYVYPVYAGNGIPFTSKDGSVTVKYEDILLHCRTAHPEFYAMKYRTEVASSGQVHDARFLPLTTAITPAITPAEDDSDDPDCPREIAEFIRGRK